jgi:hypothetical protein
MICILRQEFCSRQGHRSVPSLPRPDRLWCPTNLVSSGRRGLFPRTLSTRSVKGVTHLRIAPSLRMSGGMRGLLHKSSRRCAPTRGVFSTLRNKIMGIRWTEHEKDEKTCRNVLGKCEDK